MHFRLPYVGDGECEYAKEGASGPGGGGADADRHL